MTAPEVPPQTRLPEVEAVRGRAGRTIGAAALVLMLGNLSGSILGFVRQAVIGAVFGLHAHTDAFYAASVVPQMFYDLTIGAAISAALIPTFTETVERQGTAAFWRLVGHVLAIACVVLAVVIVILMAVAHPFVLLVAQGQPGTRGGVIATTTLLVRILLPSLLFLGISAVLMSALYSLRRFTVPAFAPSLYHVGIILGALLLVKRFGIVALPIGAVAGAAAQAGVQAVAVLRLRASMQLRLRLTPDVRKIARLYAPVAAGLVVSVAGQVADLHFKLGLPHGGLSAMQIATTLTQFPIGIAVAALSFAVLPSISSDAAFDRMQDFKHTVGLGIRFVLFLTIPAAAAYISLRSPIITVLLQRGHFHAVDTARTGQALAGYAIQIPFVGVDQLMIFALYARKNTLTPMLVGVMGVVVYVIGALVLTPRLGIFGLALANTIQNSLHAVVLAALLVASIGWFVDRDVVFSVSRNLVAMACMIVVAVFATHLIPIPHAGLLARLAALIAPLVVTGAAYLLAHVLIGGTELRLLFGFALSKFRPALGR